MAEDRNGRKVVGRLVARRMFILLSIRFTI